MRLLISVRKLDINNGPESNPVKYFRALRSFIFSPQRERKSLCPCEKSPVKSITYTYTWQALKSCRVNRFYIFFPLTGQDSPF